jgi:hypothetical protein
MDCEKHFGGLFEVIELKELDRIGNKFPLQTPSI